MEPKQEIVVHHPALDKSANISNAPAVCKQAFLDHATTLGDMRRLQIARSERVGRIRDIPLVKAAGT